MDERILIVSDKQQQVSMRDLLTHQGFFVTLFDDANLAYDELLRSEFDLVIVNLSGPAAGPDLIKRIRSTPARSILILAVAEWGSGQPTMALIQGADAFEAAPINDARLLEAVAKLMRPNLTMMAIASGIDGDQE